MGIKLSPFWILSVLMAIQLCVLLALFAMFSGAIGILWEADVDEVKPFLTIPSIKVSHESLPIECRFHPFINRTACYFPGLLLPSRVKASGSMLPTIQHESILLRSVPSADAHDLEGRMITYYEDGNMSKKIVHLCVYALDDDTCVEFGINNQRSLGEVDTEDIYGVVEWVLTPQ